MIAKCYDLATVDRTVTIARYIVDNKCTVRYAAKIFGISKSTVYEDITERLKHINRSLYRKVRRVLDVNKAERSYRGGYATREKYRALKTQG